MTKSTGMPGEPPSQRAASSWSEPVNGLSSRIVVLFEDLTPGLRYAIYLELRNHSPHPVVVTNQPRVHAQVVDSSGEAIAPGGLTLSGPILRPQRGVIPPGAYLGFRIDMQTVGIPTSEHGVVLLALGGNGWELKTGTYLLKVTVGFERHRGSPQDEWLGEIVLPPVDVVVTPQMIARRDGAPR